jgi:hypothetical protein
VRPPAPIASCDAHIVSIFVDAIRTGSYVRVELGESRSTFTGIRFVEGQPYEIKRGRDGRDRVVIRVAESTEQIVPIDRVTAVQLLEP